MKLFIVSLLFFSNLSAFDLKSKVLYNETAYITSQCYTKTIDKEGSKHNPCYSCHRQSTKPNYMSDEDLQTSYSFPEYATKNRWLNLFKDRSNDIQNISDEDILKYISQDNYKDKQNNIILENKLKNLDPKWDFNNNGIWDGYIPDIEYNFDDDGFDRTQDGQITGWRAYTYKPFLGTFWPTNGSTDDVMIRLPKVFWKNINNKIDLEIYKQNLEIVENLINGIKQTNYVGLASLKNLDIAIGLYPVGTEFIHSVRYIQTNKKGIELSKRMKELRYAKKSSWATYYQHQSLSDNEYKENHDFPDRYSVYKGDIEKGIYTNRGWWLQGFIEDKKGELRPQSYEENLYCIGCHATIGAITDATFSFKRKIAWNSWKENSFYNIKDANNEYLNYLKNNNHANEFRTNEEVYNKFFNDGKLNTIEASKIKDDIGYLIIPSKKRAMNLNKAYKVIVEEQSFIYGRDTHIKPLVNVHKQVIQDQDTHLEIIH